MIMIIMGKYISHRPVPSNRPTCAQTCEYNHKDTGDYDNDDDLCMMKNMMMMVVNSMMMVSWIMIRHSLIITSSKFDLIKLA